MAEMSNPGRRAGKKHDRNRSFATRMPRLGYYLIVTDTKETEKNYFEGMRESIPEDIRNQIVIRVEKAKTTYDLLEKTRELLGKTAQQRIPWIIVDRDEVKDFDLLVGKAIQSDINVGWSNPCFEIWMFAYFGTMPNIADSVTCCEKFADLFERITGSTYKKNDTEIYKKLNQYGDLGNALVIAERNLKKALELYGKPSEAMPACTVHHLVKEITSKVAPEKLL